MGISRRDYICHWCAQFGLQLWLQSEFVPKFELLTDLLVMLLVMGPNAFILFLNLSGRFW